MAVLHYNSASITNLNETPPEANSAGAGAMARANLIDDYVTTVSGDSSGSTYRFARVRSNVIVKSVVFEGEAMTGGAVDIGLYYSAAADGTNPANAGLVIDADFFASAVVLNSAVVPTEVTGESGVYTLNERQLPLWQAAGLSADPGGYFDIAATATTGITAGARMGIRALVTQGN